MSLALNAPCACGSGKKFKRCCYSAQDPRTEDKKTTVPKIIAAVSLVAGVVTFLVTEDLHTSSIVGIGGCVAALALVGFTDPPPPKTGSGDPAGMNFGR
jgi:hypothetical protein